MKVTSFLRDNGACGYYRVTLPMTKLAEHTETDVVNINRGDPIVSVLKAIDCDLFLLPRVADEESLSLMSVIQEDGKKIVLDYDDNMFTVSPFSPHYKDFGTEEVKIMNAEGKVVGLWEDGTHFSVKDNLNTLDAIKRAVSQADGISVTTELLADVYREYTDKVYVLPNCVDLDIWKKLPLKRENPDEFRMYWSGGSSHFEDMMLLRDVLPAVMDKYKDTKFVVMGVLFGGPVKNCPKDRIEFHNWVPTPAYPYKTAILDADLSLIPLDDTPFSNCKSNIKWVEQSALFVPSVCSLVSPYKEAYNGANGVFVENNSVEGWIAGISYMIENPIDRWNMAGEARRTVERDNDINKEVLRWHQAYQEIVNAD